MIDIDKIFEDFDEEEYCHDINLTDKNFEKFLHDNNIFEKFVENFNPRLKKINNDFCYRVLDDYNKTDYLWAAFRFENTPEKQSFWNKYDQMWVKKCVGKKI